MKEVRFNSIFADSINQFLQLRAAVLKERTVVVNRRQLKRFDDYLSTNNIHSITKEVVDGWITTLHGSDSTIVHAVCTIRIYIEYLIESGVEAYIPDVPKQHDSYMAEVNDKTYGCNGCGQRLDFDRDVIWVTSSCGLCEKCYNKLSEAELEKIREEYE